MPELLEKAPVNRKRTEQLAHTLSEWATMTGRDTRTLLAAFRKHDFFPEPGSRISFKQIESALFGEEHEQKMEAMRLDNSERRRREAEAEGDLWHTAELEKWLTENWALPLGSLFAQMPREIAPLLTCDREADIKTLEHYIETKIKPALRAKLKA